MTLSVKAANGSLQLEAYTTASSSKTDDKKEKESSASNAASSGKEICHYNSPLQLDNDNEECQQAATSPSKKGQTILTAFSASPPSLSCASSSYSSSTKVSCLEVLFKNSLRKFDAPTTPVIFSKTLSEEVLKGSSLLRPVPLRVQSCSIFIRKK